MKNNYFDDEKQGKNRRPGKKKKSKKMSAGKWIVLIIAMLVAALASFVVTIKILVPDYDLTSLLPERAVSFVEENVLKHSTTEQATTEQTTKPTPTLKMMNYLEDSEFDLEYSKQGNFIGNLLNGGKVGNDGSYIYHIVGGKGIYRFSPSSENYSNIYKTDHSLSSINLRGDYIYFIDESSSELKKLQKGTSKPKTVAKNAKFVFVYDSLVYYITTENALCVMDVKELEPTTLYYAADNELELIGISKSRVFFSVHEGNELEFLTIDNKASERAAYFRESETDEFAANFVMENGFLYYIKRDAEGGEGHFVVRQKFGSEKTFELAKTNTNIGYPVADKNRLFYFDFKDNKLILKEYNMNSKKEKTMLKSDKLSESDDGVNFYHGGEYDFIIGDGNYKASSNLTSSTNVMKFKDGKWSY